MKRILTIILILLSVRAFSQEIIISGIVTSSEDKMGMPGVAIRVMSNSSGTVTGLDGDYSLTANASDSLEFSFVGFKKLVIGINGRTIDVVMSPDSQLLEDVVVTALGIKRQKRELGYATEDISGELIAKSGSDNVINALSGRSAGVQIINGDGVAGSSSRIVIRGNNSIFESICLDRF